MKKIIALTLVVLSISTSAFAVVTPGVLAGNTVSQQGSAVYGGTTAPDALNATNPLVRFSTGVMGIINFAAAANLSSSYAIGSKHFKGSKVFGTANDSTNIYWRSSPATSASPYFTNAEFGASTAVTNDNFGVAGWTAY